MPIEITNDLGHTDYLYTFQEAAKVLGIKDDTGRPLGRNKFFRAMRWNKYIDVNNQPYQHYLNLGILAYHPTKKYWKTFHIPVFTEIGLNYIRNQIANGKFWVVYNKEEKEINKNIVKLTDIV